MNKQLYLFSLLLISIYGCEKNVTVKIQVTEEKYVVEGYIETAEHPYLILSKSLPFFGEINTNDVLNRTVTGATVVISDGNTTDTMLQATGYGIYYTSAVTGVPGRSYSITIKVGGKIMTALTTIPLPVKLDSTWWKVDGRRDSLGFAWAHLSDPDTLGNCYRWLAKRINSYTFGLDEGKKKDSIFFPPIGGSVFEDKFINGKKFDINFPRGSSNSSGKQDDNNDERFFFKRGDTIVVKFSSIDRAHFIFWRTEETQIGNNGNPFGSVAPVNGNVEGALGVWGGYSTTFDTIIAR